MFCLSPYINGIDRWTKDECVFSSSFVVNKWMLDRITENGSFTTARKISCASLWSRHQLWIPGRIHHFVSSICWYLFNSPMTDRLVSPDTFFGFLLLFYQLQGCNKVNLACLFVRKCPFNWYASPITVCWINNECNNMQPTLSAAHVLHWLIVKQRAHKSSSCERNSHNFWLYSNVLLGHRVPRTASSSQPTRSFCQPTPTNHRTSTPQPTLMCAAI